MESFWVQEFARNHEGQDFVVGDIHGHFEELIFELEKNNFDYQSDRLFAVGDLIDRGNQNRQVVELLSQKWFFSVRGNHDQFVIDQFDEERVLKYQYENFTPQQTHHNLEGKWFSKLEKQAQLWFYHQLHQLPYLIELETERGKIGICHAGIPPEIDDWIQLKDSLDDRNSRELILRTRQAPKLERITQNISLTIHGHTCFPNYKKVGNSLFIDTFDIAKKFTILNIGTCFKQE